MFKHLSVIVPCYNEGDTVYVNLLLLDTYLSSLPYTYEILAVNDGSKDNTLEELKRAEGDIASVSFLDNGENRGKGYTVKHGMLKAKGDFVCFTDADLSTPPEEIGRAIEHMLENKNTIVIGSRSIKGSNVAKKQPFYRVFMGKTFSLLANSIVPLGGIVDTQCGFKCFTNEMVQNIFPHMTMERFSFDVEILYLGKKNTYNVYEMPVTWINDETSTVNPIADSLRMFRDLFIIRSRHKKKV